jgi:hypothetical protein
VVRDLGFRCIVSAATNPSLVNPKDKQEANMNVKKLVGAVVLAFLILFVAGLLVHRVWLASTYRGMTAEGFLFRTQDAIQHKLWIACVSDLLYSILFAWVYVRGIEPKPWASQGIRFGILMWLFTVVPASLNDYVVYNLHHILVIKWIAAGFITFIVMGLAVAAVLKRPTSA